MTVDVLAIAAHPDDVELTCGGTLIKMAKRGYKTGVLDLTAGEMGTRGTVETRAKEAAKAAKLMGLSYRGILGVPDSDVQASRQHKLRLGPVLLRHRPPGGVLGQPLGVRLAGANDVDGGAPGHVFSDRPEQADLLPVCGEVEGPSGRAPDLVADHDQVVDVETERRTADACDSGARDDPARPPRHPETPDGYAT